MRSMDLKHYLKSVAGATRLLAGGLCVSDAYLRQMASGIRPISPERCVVIERLTAGQVSRMDLKPGSWAQIWPELASTQCPQPAVQGV